jgi:hypothetical protein
MSRYGRAIGQPVRTFRILPAIVGVLIFGSVGAGARESSEGRPVTDRYTPVVQSVISRPRWFKDTDHRFHLTYELRLLNAFAVPVTVRSVAVRNAKSRRTLAMLRGESLDASMSLLSLPNRPQTTLPPSTLGIVWVDVAFARRRLIPAAIDHRLVVRVPPGLPVPETIATTGARAKVDLRPPVVLLPPLRGRGWIAVGSCCDGPHRRALQPVNGRLHLSQRFAIDFNRLDSRNRITNGDPSLNTSYPTFGQPVVAVANARVVAAVDRFRDQIPNTNPTVTLKEADGNHVVLDLGRGRFAFYAHLERGSVAVHTSQRVNRGQFLGRAGNSGSSTGPHLHFHVMSGRSVLGSDGLPYVFDRFVLTGRAPPLEDLISGGYDVTHAPVPIDSASAGQRRAELPRGRDLLTFDRRG